MQDDQKIVANSDGAADAWGINKLFSMGARIKKLVAPKDQTLLVIDANRQTTCLALVTVNKKRSSFEYIGATQTTNPADDLQILLTYCSAAGHQIPEKAILVCNDLALTLLDLPSDPKNPITDPQIQEFVRWEIELVVNEQSAPPSIIELLLYQKHLAHVDLQLTYDLFKRNDQVITPASIHQQLISSNAITQQAFDTCQRLHQEKMTENEEIDCTWSKASFEQGESDTICIGIKVDYKNQWLDAFDKCNLHLLKFCSSQLSAAALITDRAQLEEEQASILLDIGTNYLSLQRVSDGNILQSSYANIQDGGVSADVIHTLCQQLMDVNTVIIYWQGIHPEGEKLVSELQEKTAIPIKPTAFLLSPSDQLDYLVEWGSEQTAAIRIIGAIGSLPGARALAVSLTGHPPPPPIFKQVNFQLIFSVFIVVVGIAVQELYLFSKLDALEKKLQTADLELQNKTATNEQIESINNEVVELNNELIELKITHATLSSRANLIETILIERQDFSQALLPMLESTIPNEVMLESVVEEKWYQFGIKGWALTQGSVDNFNSVLSRKLEPWGMYISDSPSQVNSKRYDFSFIIRVRESK